MNKKGIGIMPMEIKYLAIALIFYTGFWFVNSSLKDWVLNNWDLTPIHTLGIGFAILFFGIFLIRYKPYQYFIK